MKIKFNVLHTKAFFIILIIFSLILFTNTRISATPSILDTNKLCINLEIEKFLDSIYGNLKLECLDSTIKSKVHIDSLCLKMKSIENLNFQDLDADVEVFTDSLGRKNLKITVSGLSPDSNLKEVKKIEIKVNNSEQFSDSIKAQIDIINKNFEEGVKFDFKNMSDEEIKEYIKSHHTEPLKDEDIEITRENGKIVIKIKSEKIQER